MLADLNPGELRLLDWLLPESKPFYASVRARLQSMPVRRTDEGSIEFGRFDDDLADTIAIGEIGSPAVSVSLRADEAVEGALLSIPRLNHDTKFIWTLSSWLPGNGSTREIEIKDATGRLHFVFALSAERRVLWLHHVVTGYNQLMPVTGVLVELARLKRVPSTSRLTNDAFFDLADRSSDDILTEALLAYNKRARKFDASKVSLESSQRKDRGFFNSFRK